MTDLSDLIARVEAASGPDRELSRAIMLSVGGWHRITPAQGGGKHGSYIAPEDWLGRGQDGKPVLDSMHGTTMHRDVPHVTASIDAAVALKNRVLPGASVYLNHFAVATEPTLVWHTKAVVNEHYVGGAERKDDQIALALVAAVLKAVQAQREAA